MSVRTSRLARPVLRRHSITVRLTPDEFALLNGHVTKTGKTASELMRACLWACERRQSRALTEPKR